MPEYVEKLRVGGVNPRGRPHIVSSVGGAIVVDGDNAMGQIAAAFAMRAAIDRARETKVAFVAVRGSNHCGALDRWVLRAASEGMVGLASTNALPTMAPWGGRDKIVGMNPFAAAFPAAAEPPIVLDAAFGATAHGKIRVYQQKGHPIPEGWAYDVEGRPTTDPAAAIAGLIQPVGQHKGIGLAVVMGMLSTLLSGASYGTELGDMIAGPKPGHDGHFFAALDIAAFHPLEQFKARARIDQSRDSAEPPRCPGKPALSTRPPRGRVRERQRARGHPSQRGGYRRRIQRQTSSLGLAGEMLA